VNPSLPSIGGRAGAFEIDQEYLKKANAELNKLVDFQASAPKEEDSRTMAEVLKAKREQTEKVIEEAKQVESVAERKARLLAQRDLLREHKKKQMA
jgi:hypothetical protein